MCPRLVRFSRRRLCLVARSAPPRGRPRRSKKRAPPVGTGRHSATSATSARKREECEDPPSLNATARQASLAVTGQAVAPGERLALAFRLRHGVQTAL